MLQMKMDAVIFGAFLTGPRASIHWKKMLSYRYRNLHYKPEMISRRSEVYNGNPSTNKTVFLENKGLVQHDDGYSSTRMIVEYRLDFKLTKDPHVLPSWVSCGVSVGRIMEDKVCYYTEI